MNIDKNLEQSLTDGVIMLDFFGPTSWLMGS